MCVHNVQLNYDKNRSERFDLVTYYMLGDTVAGVEVLVIKVPIEPAHPAFDPANPLTRNEMRPRAYAGQMLLVR